MAFLRLVLIGLLIYLVIKIIGRILFSWIYITGERGNNSGSDPGSRRKKEGDTSVEDPGRDKSKIISKDEGEYIDYEEIK